MRWIRTLTLCGIALPLAWGCSDDVTGPDTLIAGLEDISASEALSTAGLDDLPEDVRIAVREAHMRARSALHEIFRRVRAGEITREEARAEAEAVHAGLMQELETLLTPDELANLRRPGLRPGPRPGLGNLDLSDDQKTEIRELLSAFRETAHGIREQVQAGELSAEDGRAAFREAARAVRAEICGVLTADQQSQVGYCSG